MVTRKKPALVIVLILAVAGLLAACGGDKKSGSGASLDLKQSFDGAAGVSVKYPDGWVVRDASNGSLYIASNQAALDAMEAATSQGPAKGQSGVVIMGVPAGQLSGMTPENAFNAIVPSMVPSGSNTQSSAIKGTRVNGQAALRVDLTDPSGEGFLLGWNSNGSLVIVAGFAAPGELKDREATLLKIVDSVTYTPPAG